ncbi:hypothetical protein [Pseudodesulfovibrio sp.]|uniref:hypothetical protein n=1 Tax=Pseudodesulfovibrio sp. TaxID=2035812 RepID=UPI0026286C65|nr:hypothetical protein [Pseudodesulfovibrio sp.]MDD3311483.1 hypothetical protein [Pseudodesulfovibrio sp.]
MDEKVIRDLKLAFACDLYETVKAARKNRDEHAFRHTMAEEGGKMVFAAVFPKKDILEFPDLDDDFVARLKTFNLLGVVTDGESGLDVFHLGGMNKPFTSAEDGRDIAKVLADEPLAAFLRLYFQAKGILIDFTAMNHEEFLQAVEGEVFKNTSFSRMQEADELLRTLEN